MNMAKAGEVIENPVTGERIEFVETAADTGGAHLKFNLYLSPTAQVAASHLHTKQDERIDILDGELRIVVGDAEPQTYKKGEWVLLKAGVRHSWWNESKVPAKVSMKFTPALNTEEFFESFFALGRDGRTTKDGAPRLLQGALMMRRYQIYDGNIPVWAQKVGWYLLAPLAYALGHRADYVQSAPAALPARRQVV
jgi:quercetin dioxygenase-like cupin family protein